VDVLIVTLLAWITANTGLAAANPPHIALVSPSSLRELYGVAPPHASFTLHAFYSKSVIYLPESWRLTGNREKSFLLHELVHHIQRTNNMTVACRGVLEQQAYDLQVKWLREQGEDDPYKLIGTDAFTVAILYACQDENARM
jgi:hypothetical protein